MNKEDLISELEKTLNEFKKLYKKEEKTKRVEIQKIEETIEKIKKVYKPKKKRESTFMEITRYPHYEIVCSNILAFYFKVEEEHQLKDLFLRALMKTINKPMINSDSIEVEREYKTIKGNFIDIVIYNEKTAIGIENKIFSSVYNDLEDYANTIEEINQNNYKIILSLKDESDSAIHSNYINVTYKRLFENVKEMLEQEADKSNKWYLYLKEFIQTIENLENKERFMERKVIEWAKNYTEEIENINEFLYDMNHAEKEVLEWYENHPKEIENVKEFLKDLKDEFRRKIDELKGYLDENLTESKVVDRIWLYNRNATNSGKYLYKTCVIEMQNSLGIAIDNTIGIGEWRIFITFRNFKNQKILLEKLKENQIEILSSSGRGILIYKFEDTIDYEEIVKKNEELLEIFNEVYDFNNQNIKIAQELENTVKQRLQNYNVYMNSRGNYLQVWKENWENEKKNGIHYEINTNLQEGFTNLLDKDVMITYVIHNEENTRHKYPNIKKKILKQENYSFKEENREQSMEAIAEELLNIAKNHDSYIDEEINKK